MAVDTPEVPASAQVVVGGGGPVGLLTAIDLARGGIDVVVVEPRLQVSRQRPRAKILDMRTLEHLRRLGLADRARELAPLPTSWSQDVSFRTHLDGEEVYRFRGVFGLTDPDDVSPELGQQLPQYVLEELLREVAVDAGVTLLRGCRVGAVAQDERGVDVEVASPDGRRRTIRCDYLVGADGAHSAVREAVGANYVGSHALRSNLGIVFRTDALDELRENAPAVQYWLVNAQVPAMMGPIDLHGGWWLVAFGVDVGRREVDPVALVDAAVGHAVEARVVATDPWTARMEIVDREVHGRVALVGDAAHLNPPFGGHGLNVGVGDAMDVAWKIRAMLHGWGGPGLLESYGEERRPYHERVIAHTTQNMWMLSGDLLAKVAESGPDDHGAIEQLREHIRLEKACEFHSLDLVLGHHLGASALLDAADEEALASAWQSVPCPGRRLPHAWLGEGRSTLDAVGSGMTLFTRADADEWRRAAADLGVPLDVVAGEVPWPQAHVLVRPDQYVAWVSGADEPDPAAVLGRAVGRAG